MKRVGKDISSTERWLERAAAYEAGIGGAYHAHRLRVVTAMLPDLTGATVVDFGCGDGVLAVEAQSRKAARIIGCDPNALLIGRARGRLADAEFHQGGVEILEQLDADVCGCLLAINVLAYLTDEEEDRFYRAASRIVRPGGSLLVTHSNALFDVFTLNAFTAAFFQSNFACDARSLLQFPDQPQRLSFSIRENPLAYAGKLARSGFRETRQEFMNFHAVPPLLSTDDPDDMDRKRCVTLDWPDAERWKLAFQCSMFASASLRV
jgi:ubiquinone/menaquinone biosynthesis C-methylase UbiE